jgi:hypothetical protein
MTRISWHPGETWSPTKDLRDSSLSAIRPLLGDRFVRGNVECLQIRDFA